MSQGFFLNIKLSFPYRLILKTQLILQKIIKMRVLSILFILFFIDFCSIAQINNKDSVFLDFTRAVLLGSEFVEMPLYVQSDDKVVTVDFSLYLDTNFVRYVSMQQNFNDMQYAEFFNTTDSKLRFTSNTLGKFPNGPSTKVITIKFKLMKKELRVSNFGVFNSYLNGDLCSSKIKGMNIIISNSDESIFDNNIHVYPTLIQNEFTIIAPFQLNFEIYNENGLQLKENSQIDANEYRVVDVSHFTKGVYYLKFTKKHEKNICTKKIIVL
jgi:hypothetical protein